MLITPSFWEGWGGIMLLDTIRQIKTGLWAFEPSYGLALQETIKNILANNTPEDKFKKENFDARHYVIDEFGNQYKSESANNVEQGIGIIHITGAIIKYGNYYCWGADELVAQAKQFDNASNIIGTIFIIDTGGGAVNAVAPFKDFLKTKKKPVLAWCDLCASAGYWIASNCDYIMASNTISSSFGSIGVMATLEDASKYWEDKGIIEHIIKADQSKHKNESFHLALKGDYKLIKEEHLNPLAIKFQNTVKANRPNLNLDIEGILSGKMFYAEQSVAYGLADSIGDFNQAIKKLTELVAVQTIMYN